MKGKLVKIKHNAVVAKLIEPDRETRLIISEILTYKVAGSELSSAFANGSWDGHSSFFSMKTDSFPAGFVRYIRKKLERQGAKVQLHRAPLPLPLGPENPKVDDFPENPDYAYQMDTVNRLVSLKALIARVATGGGKSRIFRLACARINRPTIFITTRKSLMYQMAEQMGHQRRAIGIMGDGKWTPKPNGINFAIVDTLTSRLEVKTINKEIDKQLEAIELKVEEAILAVFKKKDLPTAESAIRMLPKEAQKKVRDYRKKIVEKVRAKFPHEDIEAKAKATVRKQKKRRIETIELLRKMEFVTLEEAHEVSGNGFYDILNQCHNAVYRLALTATPFMKDDEEANMRLMAVTGPIGIQVSEKDLIDKGILAKPYFHYHATPRPEKLYRGTPWQTAYKVGIVENEYRNQFIVDESKRAKRYGLPVMLLIQHTNHGKRLLKQLKEAGLNTEFISGEHDQKKRQAALNNLGTGAIDVLIGSTILDVGVDVPAVGLVFLAGGGKAEVAMRQRVGRGLRAKKNGPNVCFVYDFTDNENKHLRAHSQMRQEVIADTPGFAENLVKAPFNYEKYGFKAV